MKVPDVSFFFLSALMLAEGRVDVESQLVKQVSRAAALLSLNFDPARGGKKNSHFWYLAQT
jgi:hypothetical protein